MIKQLYIFLALTKFRISFFSAFSAMVGFILSRQGISKEIIFPTLGVLFLACGSCALNQYQEREDDRRMERTKDRPIPSGKLRPDTGLLISIGLITAGSSILFYGTHLIAWGFGLFAIVWYNGFYTFLKKKTAFAVIPGAMIGGIPPLIGWVSGGGYFFDPKILAVSFFFFMWQVPHFWLLLLNFGKDYENAGFPTLNQIFTLAQIKRITFIWISATAVICMIIPLFGIVRSHIIKGTLFAIGFWLVWKIYRILNIQYQGLPFRFNFKIINTYLLLAMFLFAMDKFIR